MSPLESTASYGRLGLPHRTLVSIRPSPNSGILRAIGINPAAPVISATHMLMSRSIRQVWLNICGLIAGIASWKSGWEATALKPAPSLAADVTPTEPTGEKLAPHVDDILKDVIEAPSLDEM